MALAVVQLVQVGMSGDDARVRSLVNRDLILLAVVAFSAAIPLVAFLPGWRRARELRRRQPEEVVIVGRVSVSARILLSQLRASTGFLSPIPAVTFDVTVSQVGLTFWGGWFRPVAIALVPWEHVVAFRRDSSLSVGDRWSQIGFEFRSPLQPIWFVVASGGVLGAGVAREPAVSDAVEELESARRHFLARAANPS